VILVKLLQSLLTRATDADDGIAEISKSGGDIAAHEALVFDD
jgi:hypothetical protein